MKCVIIAAGKGSRLRRTGDSKPLIPILGVPLIERVIRSAWEAGADDFYVVTGYHEERIRTFLTRLTDRTGIPITPIVNGDWEKENGLSVLKARQHLGDPFLLLMADHLFEPSIAREMLELPLAEGEISLAVDRDLRNSLVDMGDVTRVKTERGKINNIGKGLTDFNGFDTGIFRCTPAIFGALERCAEESGDTSLSGAVQLLAGEGRAKAVDINGQFWIDIDDPMAVRQAENALLADLGDKPNDGPVSRHLNRPLSLGISRRLVTYGITPNQISLFSFVCSVLAAGLLALGGYLALLLGGFLAQFASLVDGCDGEVARLKFQASPYGGWLDAVLDRYADAFLLFGLTWHAYADKTDSLILLAGFLAIIGSFMVSYTADKHDRLMLDHIRHGKGFRLGRDVRVFLIFLGALFNQATLTLVVIAAVMNVETIRRVIICRTMDSIQSAKQRIRATIAASKVPEDPLHAENTLEGVLRLDAKAGQALQIAALAHDIDRAVERRKVRRCDYDDYEAFKAAHARNGANILRTILAECGVAKPTADEACRLVVRHEVGGDYRSDLLKDADSISYFEVNMPFYYEREGWEETKRRSIWGYRRLSVRGRETAKSIIYDDEALTGLLKEVIREAGGVNRAMMDVETITAPSSAGIVDRNKGSSGF